MTQVTRRGEKATESPQRPKLKTSAAVLEALRLRYPPDSYALLEQVGNGTGFHCNRHADAIVMSLWPSRGLEIIGIEVKVSRSDWVRELASPEKADQIAIYCDRWYLAVGDEAIVQPGELPKGWGLLVPKPNETLKCKVEASLVKPEPKVDRAFLGAILRRAQEQLTPSAKLHAEYLRGKREEAAEAEERKKWDKDGAQRDLERLQKIVHNFEQQSGVKITDDWYHEKVGEAVRAVMNGAHAREKQRLQDLHKSVLRCAESIANELKLSAEKEAAA